MITIDKQFVEQRIVKRARDAHKGNFGKVLVYAGSAGMAGAAILCARAALRSGAGLVRILIPSFEGPLLGIFQCSVPEATCVQYSEGMDFSEYDAIAAGPGLGREDVCRHILSDIISRYQGKLVLDADALNLVSASQSVGNLVKCSEAEIVMTPHVGEARRLLGRNIIDMSCGEGRKSALETIAEMYGAVVVLKGAGTLVGDSSALYINTTGNPGMATGGSGDVLTGVIASLCGQGLNPLEAAACGVWVHGKAGDMAAGDMGEMGLISSDIADYVPKALKSVY